MAHPPRSKPPLRSSSGPPNPCITPSTETLVVVVSFMVGAPSSLSLPWVGWWSWSQLPLVHLALDSFFREDGIDLADGLAQSLFRAHGQDLLHGLGVGERDLDRHARASLGDLLDADADRVDRHVRVGRAVRVGKAGPEENAMRRVDLQDVPGGLPLIARGARQVGLDATARR